METRLKLESVGGAKMEVIGINYRFENGIHYLSDGSYPDSIVKEVIPEETE